MRLEDDSESHAEINRDFSTGNTQRETPLLWKQGLGSPFSSLAYGLCGREKMINFQLLSFLAYKIKRLMGIMVPNCREAQFKLFASSPPNDEGKVRPI